MPKESPSPLVSAEWLQGRLGSPDLVLLDATFFLPNQGRDAHREYLATHLPGARFFDIDAVADRDSPLPHMLPAAAFFADCVGRLGIENHHQVVIYDGNNFLASARVWWTFRVFGHSRVAVLDGGLARWLALGLPTESGEPSPAVPRSYTATFHPGLVRRLDEVRARLHDAAAQIVDARSPGRFAGSEPEPRPGVRSGHIPGSRNLFFMRLIDDTTKCLKPPAELEREFRSASIDPQRPVIATCGSGVTAAILALALYRLGNPYAAVYDGSWTEWGSRDDTPVSTA
ncbi:3-mercaptopyruvate sulfurtransferase [Candidatus Methylocalor cossyra]|uniref:Sulfurtransferase n=1 Tax=Candidatus Methylocalor cossyra TaxID=3108543 RepID=A0ABP1C7L5_9GAMM